MILEFSRRRKENFGNNNVPATAKQNPYNIYNWERCLSLRASQMRTHEGEAHLFFGIHELCVLEICKCTIDAEYIQVHHLFWRSHTTCITTV